MANLAINNGGVSTNKGGLPSIDLRYGPYASIAEAYAQLGPDGDDVITPGLTVGILSGSMVIEYWFQGGTSQEHLVPKQMSASSDGMTQDKPTLKVLCFGNSFTHDALNYSPFLFHDMVGGQAQVELGLLTYPGQSLQGHLSSIDGNGGYAYNHIISGDDAWADLGTQKINTILESTDWDCIILQQKSTLSPVFSTYEPYLTSIIDRLFSKKNNIKLGWLLTQASSDNSSNYPDSTIDPDGQYQTSETMYDGIAKCVRKLLAEYPFEFVIPSGTAIQYARHTGLVGVGDMLTYDGYHLQEGLPCLIPSYTAAATFIELLGLKKVGFFGNTIRPTTEWLGNKNMTGQNGPSIGVNDSNCLLAQQCAILALRHPTKLFLSSQENESGDDGGGGSVETHKETYTEANLTNTGDGVYATTGKTGAETGSAFNLWDYTDYLSIPDDATQFSLTANNTRANNFGLAWYTAEGYQNFISGIKYDSNTVSQSGELPVGAKYVRFCGMVRSNDGSSLTPQPIIRLTLD